MDDFSRLSLETVERSIIRNLPHINVISIDQILEAALAHTKDTEVKRALRESLIESFGTNLDKETVAYIRDRLLEAHRKRTAEDSSLEPSEHEDDNKSDSLNLDLTGALSDRLRAQCPLPSCGDTSPCATHTPTLSILSESSRSLPRLSDVSSFLYKEPSENADEASSLKYLPSVPSFPLVFPEEGSDISVSDSIQFAPFPSNRYRCSVDFIKRRGIDRLFPFLMSHLLVTKPDEPIPFLVNLVDAMIAARDKGGAPPLLYGKDDLDALFGAMDPTDTGYISEKQYRVALKTLGVTVKPSATHIEEDKGVPFDVFRDSAKKYLIQTLKDDILCPSLKK